MDRELLNRKLLELSSICKTSPIEDIYRALLDIEGMVEEGMTGTPEGSKSEDTAKDTPDVLGNEKEINRLIQDLLKKWVEENEKYIFTKNMDDFYKIFH